MPAENIVAFILFFYNKSLFQVVLMVYNISNL